MSELGPLEDYWSGVAQRLQIEADLLNRLVLHNGEMGRANEGSLSQLLTSLLPSSLGVGTGIVIDSEGGRSLQTDVIIFDRAAHPQVMAQTMQLLYPIETVLLAVEVKTTVDAAAVVDIGNKREALGKLKDSRPNTMPPAFSLFGYNCSGAPATIARHINALPAARRLSSACIMNPGMVTVKSDADVAFVPLHKRDSSDSRISQEWEAPPTGHRAAYIQRGRSVFPVARFEPYGESTVFDPGRALLLYSNAILGELAQRGSITPNWLGKYLPDIAQEIVKIPS